jgi:hypothetical protein
MNIKFFLILDSCNKNNDAEPDFQKNIKNVISEIQ